MSNVIELQQSLFSRKMPVKPLNKAVRAREHLLPGEIQALITAAGRVGRHGHRDKTLILVMYRHGLRVGESVNLVWEQIDFDSGVMHVSRLKNGSSSTHPLGGKEIRALRRLKRSQQESRFVFTTERKGPLTTSGVRKIIARAGKLADLPFPVHPHQLRHGCGYYLANKGIDTRSIQHYLGHKNIQHTVQYTALASNRFNNFWSD